MRQSDFQCQPIRQRALCRDAPKCCWASKSRPYPASKKWKRCPQFLIGHLSAFWTAHKWAQDATDESPEPRSSKAADAIRCCRTVVHRWDKLASVAAKIERKEVMRCFRIVCSLCCFCNFLTASTRAARWHMAPAPRLTPFQYAQDMFEGLFQTADGLASQVSAASVRPARVDGTAAWVVVKLSYWWLA